MKKLILLLLLTNAVAAFAAKPNIVYILADDMGVGDVSVLNPEAKLKTPNIDSLAANGMRFSDAHSSSAVCTPTRYGIMTGRYSWRSELKKGVLQGYSRALISPERDTVASLLSRNGYNTAIIGKWHLGLNWRLKDGSTVTELQQPKGIESEIDFAKPFTGGPCDLGFDSWWGINASLDFPPYAWLKNDRVAEIPTQNRPSQGGKRNGQPDLMMRAGLQTNDFKPEMILKGLTKRAVQYIKAQKPNRPFFLYMPLNAPHTPVVPRPEFKGKSQAGIYGDFIQEIDWSVGEIIAALKAQGFLENTLVIFTADNGASRASLTPELEEQFDHHPSGIYKGRKGSLDDGGHRVPFIAQWPDAISAGSQCDIACNLNDLYGTCAELTGAKNRPQRRRRQLQHPQPAPRKSQRLFAQRHDPSRLRRTLRLPRRQMEAKAIQFP